METMQKGTITVLGHQVECENETGDTIDGDRLSKTIKEGRKIGILYKPGTDNIIGTWKVINPEADKWKEIAGMLYEELKESGNYSGEGCWGSASDNYEKVITQYEQLIQKENE